MEDWVLNAAHEIVNFFEQHDNVDDKSIAEIIVANFNATKRDDLTKVRNIMFGDD